MTSAGKLAAAGLSVTAGLSVAPRRRCWQWDLRVGVGQQRRRLHGEQEFSKVLVWDTTPPPPPTTGKARGWHADLPTKTKAELAADRRQTP